jgi:hypothetical protein
LLHGSRATVKPTLRQMGRGRSQGPISAIPTSPSELPDLEYGLVMLTSRGHYCRHLDVRTTLTIDDDVAAKLKNEMRRSGTSFRETVNRALRRGLNQQASRRIEPFVIRTRALGLRPGLDYDKVSDLLDQIEGPLHR